MSCRPPLWLACTLVGAPAGAAVRAYALGVLSGFGNGNR